MRYRQERPSEPGAVEKVVLLRSIDELASTASVLASPVAIHGQAVSDRRAEIKSASDELVWTVGVIGAVTAVAAVAIVLFTGGLGALGSAEWTLDTREPISDSSPIDDRRSW